MRSHRMPPDPCWQESSWRRGGGPARLGGIVATKILVFSAHWSQIKFSETEFGANRKMALTLKPQNGEYNRFLPQGACLPFIGNPGNQTVGAHSQVLEIWNKRCRGPEFSLFALFGNSH